MQKRGERKDFDFFIEEYLCYCQSRHLRPKTLNSYDQSLRLFARWAVESQQLKGPQEVREQTIRRYICDLQERGKYSFYANDDKKLTNNPDRRRDYRQPVSITTINNYIRNLRAFFNWFEEEPESVVNPMRKIRQLKCERQPREYLEDSEVVKLLGCFDKSYFSECRDATITQLILDTGMRLGECLRLQVGHVDMNERVIEIPADLTKGRKTRCVFFSVKTARVLQRWLRYKDRYLETANLFPVKATGTPLEVSTFETSFKRYVERAGIKKEFSPHALRNNFAKRCIIAGMDIYTLSRILGHSSVSVTEQAYLDLTDRDIRRCYQHYSPIDNLR